LRATARRRQSPVGGPCLAPTGPHTETWWRGERISRGCLKSV